MQLNFYPLKLFLSQDSNGGGGVAFSGLIPARGFIHVWVECLLLVLALLHDFQIVSLSKTYMYVHGSTKLQWCPLLC